MLRRNSLDRNKHSSSLFEEPVSEIGSSMSEVVKLDPAQGYVLDKENIMSRRPTRLTLELLNRAKELETTL